MHRPRHGGFKIRDTPKKTWSESVKKTVGLPTKIDLSSEFIFRHRLTWTALEKGCLNGTSCCM